MTDTSSISALSDTELKVLVYDIAIEMQRSQQIAKLAQMELAKRENPDLPATLSSLQAKIAAAALAKQWAAPK
jgi:hypothetical protein